MHFVLSSPWFVAWLASLCARFVETQALSSFPHTCFGQVTDITGNFLPYPFVAGAVRRIWLHTNCARTAPEVAFDGANFYNAMKATARSAGLKCSVCKQKGAPPRSLSFGLLPCL